jgi:putrescine transport system substrate-binding protein
MLFKRFSFLTFFVIAFVAGALYVSNQKNNAKRYVNVYNWYGMIPTDVVRDFEKETGIQVRYDYYDNNEILEAKLMASNSGYDVVFPSAMPYVKRQIQAGAYAKINKAVLSNFKHLDPLLLEKIRVVDKNFNYAIPLYWGTFGVIVDVDRVKDVLEGPLPERPFSLLMDLAYIQKLAPYGVTFLEESTDVYPLIATYLGLDHTDHSDETLARVTHHLKKLRPFISSFSGSAVIDETVRGESIVAMSWSGEGFRACAKAKEVGRNLQFFLPKSGSSIWVDMMAIPKGAPNPENAHIFINFLMRPDIAARLSNYSNLATTNRTSWAMTDDSIRNESGIFLSDEMLAKCFMDKPTTPEFDRKRNRQWTMVRFNLFEEESTSSKDSHASSSHPSSSTASNLY